MPTSQHILKERLVCDEATSVHGVCSLYHETAKQNQKASNTQEP